MWIKLDNGASPSSPSRRMKTDWLTEDRYAFLTKDQSSSGPQNTFRESSLDSACDTDGSAFDAFGDATDADTPITLATNQDAGSMGSLQELESGILSTAFDFSSPSPLPVDTIQDALDLPTCMPERNPTAVPNTDGCHTFPQDLMPTCKLNGDMMDTFPWTPASNSIDEALSRDNYPSLLPYDEGLDLSELVLPTPSPKPPSRQPSSKTTLELEDVDPLTLSRVIELLTERKTRMKMEWSSNNETP